VDSEMGLSGKTVLVVGTGISGIAAVNLLATQSANIILLDGNTELSPETVAAKFSEDIHYDLILGDLPDQVMDRIDLAVLSPGVPTDLPFVVRMQEAGIPIWGEIELAYAIGLADPVSVMVDTFGTGRVSDEKIASWLMEHIDMRPGSITSRFELRRPIYRRVSCGGHFGENAVGLPWEWTDIAEVLQKEILS